MDRRRRRIPATRRNLIRFQDIRTQDSLAQLLATFLAVAMCPWDREIGRELLDRSTRELALNLVASGLVRL